MDFFKAVFAGLGGDEDRRVKGFPTDEELMETLKNSEALFHELRDRIIEESRKICPREGAGSPRAFMATLLIFATVWRLVGWAWHGVRRAYKSSGTQSPIYRLWRVMQAVMGADDAAEASENLSALIKEIGDE